MHQSHKTSCCSSSSTLCSTIKKISQPGKGILAADESIATIGKRFDQISLPNTEENLRRYRELLLTTPGLESSISGVILFEETLSQKTSDGKSFVSILQEKGVQIGVKVDLGLRQLPNKMAGLKYSVGLDTLPERLRSYKASGAVFAKWRSAVKLTPCGALDPLAAQQVAREQALYAAVCQENGVVPIVEPELLVDGQHTREQCQKASEELLAGVFKALNEYGVCLECIMLKPAMTLPGIECSERETEAIGERVRRDASATVCVLRRSVPSAVPAIMFLSGGQGEEEATLHLNEINKHKEQLPWFVSFSYGRALQDKTLKSWGGNAENEKIAQGVLGERAAKNGEAQKGELKVEWAVIEKNGLSSLFEKNYTY